MSRSAEQEWLQMLAELVGRDAPVELSRAVVGEAGEPKVYRSRLFHVESDASIVVERPQQAALDKAFDTGDDIELLIARGEDRLIATCTIRDTTIRQINRTVRAVCYRLSPGRRPQRDQRRSFYRANTAAAELSPAVLVHEGDAGSVRVEARVVNISGSGLGVVARGDAKLLQKLKLIDRFMCSTQLEQDHEPLNVPVRVARREKIDATGLLLGLAFEPGDAQAERAVQDQMVRLAAAFQRAELHRRRA